MENAFFGPQKKQQILAGNLAAILWNYFQGGRTSSKKMKSDEIESLRPDWSDHDMVIAHCALKPTEEKQKTRKVHLFRKRGHGSSLLW